MLPGNSIQPLKTPGTMRALLCNELHPALHVRLERFYWTRSQDPAEQKALPPRGKLKHINYFIFLTTPGAKQKEKNHPRDSRTPATPETQRTLRLLFLTAAESERPPRTAPGLGDLGIALPARRVTLLPPPDPRRPRGARGRGRQGPGSGSRPAPASPGRERGWPRPPPRVPPPARPPCPAARGG